MLQVQDDGGLRRAVPGGGKVTLRVEACPWEADTGVGAGKV